MMKSKNSDCPKSPAKADLSQWLRLLKRHVLRRRFVLKILLLTLRLIAEFED